MFINLVLPTINTFGAWILFIFNTRMSHFFTLTLPVHNMLANCIRKLFKHSKDVQVF